MQRGRRAPSADGDLTAESIMGAAIPSRRSAGRIPNALGPLLRRVRRPVLRTGVDSNANAFARRLHLAVLATVEEEAGA